MSKKDRYLWNGKKQQGEGSYKEYNSVLHYRMWCICVCSVKVE